MTEVLLEEQQAMVLEMPDIDYDRLITEDDEPVDNIFSAKQQRLLVEPLYSSWNPEHPFLADANVGIFSTPYQPAIVPDMFLSLDVQAEKEIWKKENRSYFLWKFGKPPDVVVEVVSNKKGGETGKKFDIYARMRVWYYVIFDPQQLIQEEMLQMYQLSLRRYVPLQGQQLEQVGLGLTLWDGVFEGFDTRWLRWLNSEGKLIPTGLEGKDQEQQRADQERQRAERLAAQLRAMGIEPDDNV